MKKIIWLLVLLIFVYACAPTGPEVTRTDSTQPTVETVEPTQTTEEVKEFKIVAKQWEFEPDTINVKKGDKVRLLINSIDVTHGFQLGAFGIEIELEPNQETVVEFVVDREGMFFFRCNIFCGKGHTAMVGKVVVT